MARSRFAFLCGCVTAAPLLAQPSLPSPVEDKYGTPVPIPRYALVIGIEDYPEQLGLGRVANARNDAQAVAQALSDVMFTNIRILRDEEANTKEQVIQAVYDLAAAADVPQRAATIVFYFAGHGFQLDNVNYLAPRLARKPVRDRQTGTMDKSMLREDSIPIGNIIAGLKSRRRPGVTILMLDACRTNILSSGTETPGSAEQNGFYPLAVEDAQNAVLSFAAKFGTAAKSRSRYHPGNSPYAGALKSLVPIAEGVPLNPLLVNLRSYVSADTGANQLPESTNQEAAGTHFYFKAGGAREASEGASWSKVLGMLSKKCVRNYLDNYPDGRFAQHAVTYLDNEPPSAADLSGAEPCVIFF
jgi:uncharacterized caspase-like protein